MKTILKVFDVLLKLVCVGTGAALLVIPFSGLKLPLWGETVLFVLLPAIVGYLTLWIISAFLMHYLSKPEKWFEKGGLEVQKGLNDPLFLNQIRDKVNAISLQNKDKISSFLVANLESAWTTYVIKNITPQNLSSLCENTVITYIQDEQNQRDLSNSIIEKIKQEIPSREDSFKQTIHDEIKAYLQKEWYSRWLGSWDSLITWMTHFAWGKIRAGIDAKLDDPQTQNIICGHMLLLSAQLHNYLMGEEVSIKLKTFLQENHGKAKTFLQDFLIENIPGVIESTLKNENYLDAVLKKIPEVQAFLIEQTLTHESTAPDELPLHLWIEKLKNFLAEKLILLKGLSFVIGLLFGLMFTLLQWNAA